MVKEIVRGTVEQTGAITQTRTYADKVPKADVEMVSANEIDEDSYVRMDEASGLEELKMKTAAGRK